MRLIKMHSSFGLEFMNTIMRVVKLVCKPLVIHRLLNVITESVGQFQM